MTLFNDPIRVIAGRVVSLWPPSPASKHRSWQAGPRCAWALAYPTRSSSTPSRSDREGSQDRRW